MRRLSGSSRARLGSLLAGIAAVVLLPVAGAATAPGRSAADLRSENERLAANGRAAVLELYALESRLARAHDRLAALRAQSDAARRREEAARRHLAIARRALATSQRQLAERLHVLYRQGETDPMAVLLGADSLDEALTRIDDLDRTAALNASVVRQTREARRRFAALARRLVARRAALARRQAAAAAAASALVGARGERERFIAELAAKRRLNARQIAQLEAAAREAEASASAAVATRAASAPSAASAPPGEAAAAPPATGGSGAASGARTLTVVATGYALGGRTATGMPVGWGVVAVDPSVIPLGTRLTIPGYGEGVAADVGPAVRGAAIDLWFPSREQALAWGRRTVTVTLH